MGKKFAVLGILTMVAVLVGIANFEFSNNLEVIFLDVGQGDAILIQYKEQQILIDAGPNDRILQKLGEYMPFWDRKIDLVVSTHSDADHSRGLAYVLDRYQISNLIYSQDNKETKTYNQFLELSQNLNRIRGEPGQYIAIGGAVFKILQGGNMLISELETPGDDFLFMADAGFDLEREINAQSEVLKAGHHGSKNSTSLEFLQKINPRDIVISVGCHNRYGHPSPEVLERIKNFNVKTTCEAGDIKYHVASPKNRNKFLRAQ